jgi:hypothetical protein
MTGGECQMKLHTLAKIINVVKSIIRLPHKIKRGRPFTYSAKTIAVFFHTMILKGMTRFKTMHNFLTNNPSLASAFGFKDNVPNRTTLARRFKALYGFVKEQVRHMGNVLTAKKTTCASMCSVDSTMHQACGNIWHKKHKRINFIPPKLRNIDRDADWGKSEYKGWVFGYKTHLIATSSFHKLPIPLYCEVTPANKSDCPTAKSIFKSFWPNNTKYLLADKGYDDKLLRSTCQKAKTLLITPMKRYKHMNPERKKWLKFYRSKIGRKRYSQRAKTIEPLIGHIKALFNIEKLKVKGLQNVQSFLSLCVWVYQTLIYYNSIYQRPLRRLKDLVCAV